MSSLNTNRANFGVSRAIKGRAYLLSQRQMNRCYYFDGRTVLSLEADTQTEYVFFQQNMHLDEVMERRKHEDGEKIFLLSTVS